MGIWEANWFGEQDVRSLNPFTTGISIERNIEFQSCDLDGNSLCIWSRICAGSYIQRQLNGRYEFHFLDRWSSAFRKRGDYKLAVPAVRSIASFEWHRNEYPLFPNGVADVHRYAIWNPIRQLGYLCMYYCIFALILSLSITKDQE